MYWVGGCYGTQSREGIGICIPVIAIVNLNLPFALWMLNGGTIWADIPYVFTCGRCRPDNEIMTPNTFDHLSIRVMLCQFELGLRNCYGVTLNIRSEYKRERPRLYQYKRAYMYLFIYICKSLQDTYCTIFNIQYSNRTIFVISQTTISYLYTIKYLYSYIK